MTFAERTMTRAHASPVRSVVAGEGGVVVSGGEKGLFITRGGVTTPAPMDGIESPWIEQVAMFDRRIHAVTPTGLFTEGADGVMRSLPNGENVGSISVFGDRLFATADPPDVSLRRYDAAGRLQVEQLPSPVRRVFAVGERLVADTASGLAERVNDSWRVISRRSQQESFGNAHVGALAAYRGRMVVGFFDGGLAELAPAPSRGPRIFRSLCMATRPASRTCAASCATGCRISA